MSLTKSDIVDSISKQQKISKRNSVHLFESILTLIKPTLESGEDVLISGFGKFCVKNKNERRGRNPQTGKDKMLGAKRVVIFRCSQVLREKINGKG